MIRLKNSSYLWQIYKWNCDMWKWTGLHLIRFRLWIRYTPKYVHYSCTIVSVYASMLWKMIIVNIMHAKKVYEVCKSLAFIISKMDIRKDSDRSQRARVKQFNEMFAYETNVVTYNSLYEWDLHKREWQCQRLDFFDLIGKTNVVRLIETKERTKR